MAKLSEKIQHGLDESRILITGAQVLIGFDFRAVFERGFEDLPLSTQLIKLATLPIMLITLALLVAPCPFHRIVEEGEDTLRLHRFVRQAIEVALFPLALGLGLEIYVVAAKIGGPVLGVILGASVALVGLFFWYGIELIQRRHVGTADMKKQEEMPQAEKSNIEDKVDHVLTESRVVLPGVQALLGFQFITVLTDAFDKLPDSSKYLHLLSLLLLAVTTILLIAPAAYHRIVEDGEDTEGFHRLAGRFVLAALVPLALAVSLDLFIVADKVTHSTLLAVSSAGLMLLIFYGLWFGYTLYRRQSS